MATQPNPFDELWHAYHATGDPRYRAALTERYMPILVSVAEKVRDEMGGQPVVQDLVNAGLIGLLQAFDRFDPSRGVYFDTYCFWRVLGAMHDDQRRFDWATGPARIKAQELRAARDELSARLGRPPSDEELGEALGLSHGELADILRRAEPPASLNADGTGPMPTLGESRLGDRVVVDEEQDPERLVLIDEARSLLLDALKGLHDNQRYVMLLYYFERLTMAQIGQVLGLSESRISQLHKQALATLLKRLGPRRDDFLDALGM